MRAEEFLEQEAGSEFHKALMIQELATAAEAVRDEYEFEDKDSELAELSGLCADLVKVCEMVPFGATADA